LKAYHEPCLNLVGVVYRAAPKISTFYIACQIQQQIRQQVPLASCPLGLVAILTIKVMPLVVYQMKMVVSVNSIEMILLNPGKVDLFGFNDVRIGLT